MEYVFPAATLTFVIRSATKMSKQKDSIDSVMPHGNFTLCPLWRGSVDTISEEGNSTKASKWSTTITELRNLENKTNLKWSSVLIYSLK